MTWLDRSTEFAALVRGVRHQALTELENSRPEYVRQLKDEFAQSRDLHTASKNAQSSLGEPLGNWMALITSILDCDLALDKSERALSALLVPNPMLGSGWSQGAWVSHNMDQWIFQMDAWLERLKGLITSVCRTILRPQAADWKVVEGKLLDVVAGLDTSLGALRNPLAHGRGGGITGPEEERLI